MKAGDRVMDKETRLRGTVVKVTVSLTNKNVVLVKWDTIEYYVFQEEIIVIPEELK